MLAAFSVAVLVFLCFPIPIVVAMSFSSARSLEFPPPGLSLQWYVMLRDSPVWLNALGLSAGLAVTSATLALILGSLAAYGLVRGNFPGKGLVESNLMAPLIVPPVIIALSLYIVLARSGLLGTLTGLLAGHTLLSLPYVVLFLSVAIRAFDIRIEHVAETLGASRRVVLTHVLLPNLWPNALIAWLFAFLVSFDEVVLALFIGGRHVTVPKRIFTELTLQISPVITAVATVLIVMNAVVLVLLAVLARKRGAVAAAGLTP